VGNSSFTWNNGQFTSLTVDSTLNVRAAIDLADSDILRFGSSDDVQMFYNGTNNVLNIELEAAAGSIRVTDNGTDKIIFYKDGTIDAAGYTVNGAPISAGPDFVTSMFLGGM
jgi:WD40 repeat protein